MEIKIYDSFRKLQKLHDNKLNAVVLKSNLPDKGYHLKTFFLDLYGSDFDTYNKIEDVGSHLKSVYQEYMDEFYSTHGILFKLTGSKKLHLCFGTENVLEELNVRIKKSENLDLNNIFYIRNGDWSLDMFSAMNKNEIDEIKKYI